MGACKLTGEGACKLVVVVVVEVGYSKTWSMMGNTNWDRHPGMLFAVGVRVGAEYSNPLYSVESTGTNCGRAADIPERKKRFGCW